MEYADGTTYEGEWNRNKREGMVHSLGEKFVALQSALVPHPFSLCRQGTNQVSQQNCFRRPVFR